VTEVQIVDPRVEDYMRRLAARYDEPVLLEMEQAAGDRGFPIVGRLVGAMLEILARSVGARRVFEMGSGFGYSGYWFSRAVGPDGEVHLTDGNPDHERAATDYLTRAGLAGPVRFHVGDAIEELGNVDGTFDVVFNDIDKQDYPRAWEVARDRVRVGGLYICDNVIQAGGSNAATREDEGHAGWAEAIDAHNRAVATDESFLSMMIPIRDGDLVALRIA
jgi:predicted O-methyltransferase YrrM